MKIDVVLRNEFIDDREHKKHVLFEFRGIPKDEKIECFEYELNGEKKIGYKNLGGCCFIYS